jgi:hypothetical protein
MSKLSTTTTNSARPKLVVSKKTLAKKKSNRKKRLRFDKVEIIELPIILGDNPSVQDGPPLSCCWKPQFRLTCDLDCFEKFRPRRRSGHELVLCKKIREAVLRKHGFSRKDIFQAAIDAKKIKLERLFSSQFPAYATTKTLSSL